jgi:hypothetical protein
MQDNVETICEFQQGYNYHIAHQEFDISDKNRLEYKLFQNLKIYIMNLFFPNNKNARKLTLDNFYNDLAFIYINYYKEYDDALKFANFLNNSRTKSIADLMNDYMIDISDDDRLIEYFNRINYIIGQCQIIETKNNKNECNIIFHNKISRPRNDYVENVSVPYLGEYFDFIDIEYGGGSLVHSLNFNDFMVEYNKLIGVENDRV